MRNRARCNSCKDIIESTYRHDFVRCSCGTIFVDGGKEYFRAGYTGDPSNFIRVYDDGREEPLDAQIFDNN
jgi:hypothetical protein